MVNLKKLGRRLSPLCPASKKSKTKRGKSKQSPTVGVDTPLSKTIERGERRNRRSTARSRLFSEQRVDMNKSWEDLSQGDDEGGDVSNLGGERAGSPTEEANPRDEEDGAGPHNNTEEETDNVFPDGAGALGTGNRTNNSQPRSVLLSEDDYSTPESITGLIGEIEKLVSEYPEIQLNTQWIDDIEPLHQNIIKQINRVTQYVVLNEMTDRFLTRITSLKAQADAIRGNLEATVENGGTSGGDSEAPLRAGLGQADQERGFRSEYARRLSAGYIPNYDTSPEGGMDGTPPQSNTSRGFRGWTTGKNAPMKRNISGSAKVLNQLNRFSSELDQGKRAAEEAIKSMAFANSESTRKQTEVIAKLAASLSLLERRVNTLEQLPIMKELQNAKKRITGLENQFATRPKSSHPTSEEVTNLIARAIENLKEEMKNQPPPVSQVSDRGVNSAGETSTNHTDPRVDTHAFEIAALKKLAKTTRSKLNELTTQPEMGPARSTATSTPMQESLTSGNTTMLGAEYSKRTLEKLIERLAKLTSVALLDDADITEIKKRYEVDVPKVRAAQVEFSKKMSEYLKTGNPDDDLYNRCLQSSDDAEEWMDTVETLYDKRDIHNVNAEKGKTNIEIAKFTGDHKQTIFEFIEDFENAYLAIGTSKKRANIMYKQYLSQWITIQTMSLSNDYAKLKAWLIDQYGDVITIVNLLVSYLENIRKPSSAHNERLSFFLTISNTITRLERLEAIPQMEAGKLKEHMQSRVIIDRLVGTLPEADDTKFIQIIRDNGLNTNKLQGPYVLEQFKVFINGMVDEQKRLVERTTKGQNPRPKPKGPPGTPGTHSGWWEDSDDEGAFGYSVAVMGASRPSGPWWKNGLNFPCPIVGHEHELNSCEEFLLLTPKQRRNLNREVGDSSAKGRTICWSCMRPTGICKRSCRQTPVIPEGLRCSGCAQYAKERGWAALCILFCTKTEHNSLKPPPAMVHKELKKYLKGMPKQIAEGAIVYASSGYMSMNTSQCRCPKGECTHRASKSSPPCPNSVTPIIDTQTGEWESEEHIGQLTESHEDAFFLMQWIRIGESKCLVLFDRGSNVNLIDGPLAEREKLQVISDKPRGIRVVGGEEVSSGYGQYRLMLGSKESGSFHQLDCYGMPQVTTQFNEYPLHDINHEVRGQCAAVSSSEPLPTVVGGSVVHLLIGIKDIALDPQMIDVLPNGLGIFRSPFTDIYGSNICYAGPHSTFSKTNRSPGSQATMAAMLLQTVNELRDEAYGQYPPIPQNQSNVCRNMEGGRGTSLSASPLNQEDFDDLGCAMGKDLINTVLTHNSEERTEAHYCLVNKALIPISRLRELIDQDDVNDTVSYRCPECSKCITCKQTSKTTATSIQDAIDHEAIKKSIHIDRDNQKVWVDLPFTQDPDAFLQKLHRGNDNYTQAHKVYLSQCRKTEPAREALRTAHKGLVENGFIKRLSDLSPEHQTLIAAAAFRHYMIWRGQGKEDSISTSMRLIVDPTMSGLNLCLPKGENRLGKINEILIRNRVSKHSWATDISKMYNQLALNPSSYPYQLLLFHHSLDPTVRPEVWVMVTGWYGMVSTGNQAGEAVGDLCEENKEKHPDAEEPLTRARYVDDVNSGVETIAHREAQIDAVRAVLGKGGFSLKYIVRSGVKPCDKASVDGTTVKILGYKYTPEGDILSPGYSELNPNRKVRGVKKPNDVLIANSQDARQLLDKVKITRKVAMSLLAEFYDPIGLFEPLKLQYKLALSALNKYEYGDTLPNDLQNEWRDRLAQLAELPNLKVGRCVFPSNAPPSAPIRLLCLSDAGESAGGSVIYAGVELEDGSYSCGMLASKSKLMDATVPRNELTAIMHMTELAFIVKRAIGDRVNEIIYATDSTIALSWCQNTSLKLRMYVYNRVETIRRLIQWTNDTEEIPLFHISGERNMADLLTKPHPTTFETVDVGSEWHEGAPWMKLPTAELPITPYKNINLPSKGREELKIECFGDPFYLANKQSNHQPLHTLLCNSAVDLENEEANIKSVDTSLAAAAPPKARDPLLIDIIAIGWFKSIRILALVARAVANFKHKIHTGKNTDDPTCQFCSNLIDNPVLAAFEMQAEEYLFRQESKHIMSTLPKKKLKNFKTEEGILRFSGRLSEENPFRFRDLDSVPFMDAHEIAGSVPVVLADSPVFFSFLMAVHMKIVPHAGVITTMREISKKMLVLDAPKKIIAKVRADCVKCKMIIKQTVELEMQKHKFPRTMIAPPFYNVMIDIAYGFQGQPFKNARKKVNVYALVIVCLLTGATNIIALEGIETQDVVLAIEKHSYLHGIPAEVYIDNGTQLKALEHAEFSVQAIDTQLHDSLGLRVSVSNAKSHEERGRVERRIGLIRDMLQRLTQQGTQVMSALQWDTLFAKVANAIDNLPLAKGNTSNSNELGYEILTANRIKLGRNNNRSLSGPGITLDMSPNLTRILDRNRQIQQSWYQLFIDQVHLLTLKPPKWETTSRLPVEGDIVLFVLNDSGYGKNEKTWKLGKIVRAQKTKVDIQFFSFGKGKVKKTSTLQRNPREVSILFSTEELFVNSNKYFQKAISE